MLFQPILCLIFHKQNLHLHSKENSVAMKSLFFATFDYLKVKKSFSYKLLDIHLARIYWLLMDFKTLSKLKY